MAQFILTALLAGFALASPAPEYLRTGGNEDNVEIKPEVSSDVLRTQANVAATLNTYVSLDAYVFGQTNYLEENVCYYLPNYVGQVTWVKPSPEDQNYQVFFYTSRDCEGPKLVADVFYGYDIRRRYSVSVELIDLSDSEEPPTNITVSTARTGRVAGGQRRQEKARLRE